MVEATETPRRYHRIPSIIPVDYQLLLSDERPLDPEVRTGFTRDVSVGGLCLQITQLPDSIAAHLDDGKPKISVDVTLPSRRLRILGQVAWTRHDSGMYILGVEFLDLATENGEALAAFARRAQARPRIRRLVVFSLALLLGVALGLFYLTQSEVEESREAASRATAQQEKTAEELAEMWRDLRRLAIEAGELSELMKEGDPSKDSPEIMGPALEDLRKSIAKLRALVLQSKGIEEEGSDAPPSDSP